MFRGTDTKELGQMMTVREGLFSLERVAGLISLSLLSGDCVATQHEREVCCGPFPRAVAVTFQSKGYADAEDAEFQLGADLEERGGMYVWVVPRALTTLYLRTVGWESLYMLLCRPSLPRACIFYSWSYQALGECFADTRAGSQWIDCAQRASWLGFDFPLPTYMPPTPGNKNILGTAIPPIWQRRRDWKH